MKFFYAIDFNVIIGSSKEYSFHIEGKNKKEVKELLDYCITEAEKIE